MESGNCGGAIAIAIACGLLAACGNPNEPSRTVALQIAGDVKTLGADLRIGGGVGGAEVTLPSGGSFSFPRTYVIVTAAPVRCRRYSFW